jgi:NAD+ synthase
MKRREVIEHIVQWLKDYAHASNVNGFVVGVSGGIDSALTSTLCAMTGKKTLLLEMPIHQAVAQVDRAQEHITWLKSKYDNVMDARVDLTSTFDAMVATLPAEGTEAAVQLSLANTRARLRMTTLYYFAGIHGLLVAGTGNKVEDFGVGFFTKYGDGGVDISPIADLYKTEVYALCAELGIAQSIQVAAPTDGLFGDDRTDEDQIGASYPELEWAMEFVLSGGQLDSEELTERQQTVLKIYLHRNRINQHKMLPIPVCVIPTELK